MKQETEPKSDILLNLALAMFIGGVVGLVILFCSGCCISKGKITRPDNSTTEFSNVRILWVTESYKFNYSTNTVTLDVQKSNPDAQTMGAIVDIIKTAK
jgi:hypothetical protein